MPYFHPLNFIRFLLALGVVLFHYSLNYYPFDLPGIKTAIQNSGFRVSFFFFISGFVMCLVYSRQWTSLLPAAFYKKRLSRIFPAYFLAFIITLLLVLFVNNAGPKGLVIILHALGLQSWNPGYVLDLNYPAWSISVELAFYLGFPFMLRWMMRLSATSLLWVTIGIWVLQSFQHILFVDHLYNGTKVMEEFINAFPLWHAGTFIAGMAIARFIVNGEVPEVLKMRSSWILLMATVLLGIIVIIPNPVLKYIHNGLLSPLFALIVLGLYYDTSWLTKALSHHRVSALGDLSYGLLIYQYPVWIICISFSSAEFVKSSGFFFLYLALLLLVSWLLNRFFEKPLLRILRRNNKTVPDAELHGLR